MPLVAATCTPLLQRWVDFSSKVQTVSIDFSQSQTKTESA